MSRVLLIFTMLVFCGKAQSSECNRLFYEEQDLSAALQPCLDEEMFFHVAYIQGVELKNCLLMREYYLRDGGSSSLGNLGISLLYGSNGCVKSTTEAIGYLKSAIEDGSTGYAYLLGEHYWLEENKKAAKRYYIKATQISSHSSEWHVLRRDEAVSRLYSRFPTSEQIELFLQGSLGRTAHCDLSEKLLKTDPEFLMNYLARNRELTGFKARLCTNQKLFFEGYKYEIGLGNQEDFREAYRFYLLAGANGSVLAKDARERIRAKLTEKQISQATCIAGFGEEPSLFQKWRCGW